MEKRFLKNWGLDENKPFYVEVNSSTYDREYYNCDAYLEEQYGLFEITEEEAEKLEKNPNFTGER